MARDAEQMHTHLRDVLNDGSIARSLAASGLETIRMRHTCGHRVNELLGIYDTVRPAPVQYEAPLTVEVQA